MYGWQRRVQSFEGRAVTFAFLRRLTDARVTKGMCRQAAKDAITYLEKQDELSPQQRRDLEKRRRTRPTWARRRLAAPYITGRDVHRYIVKAETDDLLCRYCELPGMAEQKDPATGMYHFGLADHFFSYNWDSPFDDVVDAICAHSDRAVAEGKPPECK